MLIALYHVHPETDEVRGFTLVDPDERERWPDDPLCELPEEAYENAFTELVAEAEKRLGMTGTPSGRGPGELRVRAFRIDAGCEFRIALMTGTSLDSGKASIASFAQDRTL